MPISIGTGLPVLPEALLTRPRLNWALTQASSTAVTLVVAPAGFGKTTAVADWATHRDQPPRTAWCSLSEFDNVPQQFWASLFAAIKAVHPEVSDSPELQVAASRELSDKALVAAVSNALYGLTEPLTIVLDDFENISDPEILRTVSLLVGAMPSATRIVLCSRTSPGLPLSRWRASGRLAELGVEDLRFTDEEAGAYLDPLIAGKLRPDEEAELVRKAQGWIAVLYLAVVGVQRAQDASGFVDGFGGSHDTVMDLVVDEILHQLPERERSFLLHTSILGTLTPSICDAVTEGSDSAGLLKFLGERGIFIGGDGARGTWTYHGVIGEALRGQLEAMLAPADIDALHLRAAAAYAERGRFDEALAHASADADRVRELIETHGKEMLRQVPRAVDAALAQLPEAVVAGSEQCGTIQLAAAAVVGNREHLEAIAGREDLNGSPGRAEAALAMAHYLRGGHLELDAFACPADKTPGRGLWAAAQGVMATLNERYEEGAALLRNSTTPDDEDPFSSIALISALAWNQVQAGSIGLGLAYAARALALAEVSDLRWFHGVRWAELAQAQASFDRGRIEDAHNQIEHISESLVYDGRFKSETHLLAAQISAARGDDVEAAEHLAAAAPAVTGPDSAVARERVAVANARRSLLKGDVELAAAWLPNKPLEQHRASLGFRLTFARLLVETDRLGEAVDLLETIVAATDTPTRHLVEAKKLQAIAASRAGDTSASLLLESAVAAGRAEGLTQPFVDDSLAIAAISRRSHNGGQPSLEGTKPGAPNRPAGTVTLVEPLTDRELSVLRLLPTRLTNHEIADELYISVNTVKTHVKAIYRKLEVSSRNAAVDTAVSLRLV